jgi:hypothetical protein
MRRLLAGAGCGASGRDSHFARIYAGDPLPISNSSSQLMSHLVAAARRVGVQGRVARVLVQVGEIGHWRRMLGRGLGRRAHSNSGRSSRVLLGASGEVCSADVKRCPCGVEDGMRRKAAGAGMMRQRAGCVIHGVGLLSRVQPPETEDRRCKRWTLLPAPSLLSLCPTFVPDDVCRLPRSADAAVGRPAAGLSMR